MLENSSLEDAFKSKLLSLPGQAAIANHIGKNIDPAAVFAANWFARRSVADALEFSFLTLYERLDASGVYSPDADSVGRRALRNAALDFLVHAVSGKGIELAARQAREATNLNDRMAALTSLAQVGGDECDQALAEFYAGHKVRSSAG